MLICIILLSEISSHAKGAKPQDLSTAWRLGKLVM